MNERTTPSAMVSDPFARQDRDSADPATRIRPLDIPDEQPAHEAESLRYLLLLLALLSIAVPIALLMRDDPDVRPKARDLTAIERSHLPQMQVIPAGVDC